MHHDQQIIKQLKAALADQSPFKLHMKSGGTYLIASKDDVKISDDSDGIVIRDHGAVLTFHFLKDIVAIEPAAS